MAGSFGPLSDPRAERNIFEVDQQLCSQLVVSQQQFQDLKEKYLTSQAIAYSLAKQLQKYKCEENKDVIESVLGKKLQWEQEPRAEEPTLAEKLRECTILIRNQGQKLSQLREQLREGRHISILLIEHLQDLLNNNYNDNHQGQDFRELLAEGHRLAERLAHKLCPEVENKQKNKKKEELVVSKPQDLCDSSHFSSHLACWSDECEVGFTQDGTTHTQDTDDLRNTLVTSRIQLEKMRKEADEQKVDWEQLKEKFKETQKKIMHFRDECMAYDQELCRRELSEKEDMSQIQQIPSDDQNMTPPEKCESSEAHLTLDYSVSPFVVSKVSSIQDVATHTQDTDDLRNTLVTSRIQLEKMRKEADEQKVDWKQLKEKVKETQKSMHFRDEYMAYDQELCREELLEEEDVSQIQQGSSDDQNMTPPEKCESSESDLTPGCSIYPSAVSKVSCLQNGATVYTQEIECCIETWVAPEPEPQGPGKEVEFQKVERMQLSKKFHKMQRKIAQFKNKCIAYRKGFARPFSRSDVPETCSDGEAASEYSHEDETKALTGLPVPSARRMPGKHSGLLKIPVLRAARGGKTSNGRMTTTFEDFQESLEEVSHFSHECTSLKEELSRYQEQVETREDTRNLDQLCWRKELFHFKKKSKTAK